VVYGGTVYGIVAFTAAAGNTMRQGTASVSSVIFDENALRRTSLFRLRRLSKRSIAGRPHSDFSCSIDAGQMDL
jgi:hypothetical protein